MSVGNRVYLKRQLPAKELVKAFRDLATANVADCMGRLCAMHHSIQLVSSPRKNMCGAALTVRARAGDNLMIHKALDMAEEGDVIVVETGFGEPNSLVGEIIMNNAIFRKMAGFVFDAPIRDKDTICKMDFPVFATGFTPGGPYKEGPGEINVPISCGNMAVLPGDIILGDADGVIVIPRCDAKAILEEAIPFSQADQAKLKKAADGTWDRSWVAKQLEKNKVEIIDDFYRM
ncbi:MAG: RraA family protein [Treponema sp.]|nr:RraA family protein [Treponema sp.]